MDPVRALERIVYLLDRAGADRFRVQAYRGAADAIRSLPGDELARLAAERRLESLAGVGPKTATVIAEALAGETPGYLVELEKTTGVRAQAGDQLLAALRGDCHTHSDWSDGGASIEEMARAAAALGHEYVVLTDHSPRLTVARGLSRERLEHQLEIVEQLNERLSPFRILTGIEVDILEDGALDQDDDLLDRLDLVVASVHSKLRMPEREMTRRMCTAVANPHVDILGHCTGRLVTGRRGRPESTFDPELVFHACERFDTAVEINCRPERLDPPRRLLRMAVDMGCRFSIDTDAHAPGQLEWQPYGCDRAVECGVAAERVINTQSADEVVAWARSR
jgi:putative hydrolase